MRNRYAPPPDDHVNLTKPARLIRRRAISTRRVSSLVRDDDESTPLGCRPNGLNPDKKWAGWASPCPDSVRLRAGNTLKSSRASDGSGPIRVCCCRRVKYHDATRRLRIWHADPHVPLLRCDRPLGMNLALVASPVDRFESDGTEDQGIRRQTVQFWQNGIGSGAMPVTCDKHGYLFNGGPSCG